MIKTAIQIIHRRKKDNHKIIGRYGKHFFLQLKISQNFVRDFHQLALKKSYHM